MESIKEWLIRFERPIASFSLVGGFVFDAVTLKRVDLFWENLWVIAHLLIVAICIILINRKKEVATDHDPSKLHFWLVNAMQFFFGGLLSTFLVFYFRSGTIFVSWPFLLILVVAFVANERLKHHFASESFQISFFFLSLYSFAIFIVPVVMHQIGDTIFVLSGIVSVLILWVFLVVVAVITEDKAVLHRKTVTVPVLGIVIIMNLLYFFNIMPPIPLALKDGGVYHSVEKDGLGNYVVVAEKTTWRNYFDFKDTFHLTSDGSIFAFSAVFSPARLNTDIYHEWQKYNVETKKWTTLSTVRLKLVGGRDNGFRTYSTKENITLGQWRVNVKSISGQLIGHIRFDVENSLSKPDFSTLVY